MIAESTSTSGKTAKNEASVDAACVLPVVDKENEVASHAHSPLDIDNAPFVLEVPFCHFPGNAYIGSNLLLYGSSKKISNRRSNGGTWPFYCLVGPDWPCQMAAFGLILIPSYFWLRDVTPAIVSGNAITIMGIISTVGASGCLAMTGCSDPGIVMPKRVSKLDMGNVSQIHPETGEVFCTKCTAYRPSGAMHCYRCNVCVEGMDHHCPWSGKCIGRKNLRYFYAFLSFLCFHVLFVLVTTAVKFIRNP